MTYSGLNERAISIEVVQEAVNEIKIGKLKGSRFGCFSCGVSLKRLCASDKMASETVERMFSYGGSTYALVWCM